MLNFSPCIEIFFNDLSFIERIRKIAAIGYNYFEFWSWWDKDVNALLDAAKTNNMQCAALCTKFISLVDASKWCFILYPEVVCLSAIRFAKTLPARRIRQLAEKAGA